MKITINAKGTDIQLRHVSIEEAVRLLLFLSNIDQSGPRQPSNEQHESQPVLTKREITRMFNALSVGESMELPLSSTARQYNGAFHARGRRRGWTITTTVVDNVMRITRVK